MVALQDTYDIALLISGDADGIPGINYVKSRSKHVGVAEFRRGSPADFPAKGTSSRLKIAADFVVQVYEADLIRRNLAYRAEADYPQRRLRSRRRRITDRVLDRPIGDCSDPDRTSKRVHHGPAPRDRPASPRHQLRRGDGRRLGARRRRGRDLARRPAARGARRRSTGSRS